MWENPRGPQWFSHLPDQKAEHCEGKKQLSARASMPASAGIRSPLARGAARAVAARVAMRKVSFMVEAEVLGVLVLSWMVCVLSLEVMVEAADGKSPVREARMSSRVRENSAILILQPGTVISPGPGSTGLFCSAHRPKLHRR